MFEQAKQNLMDKLDSCYLRVLVFVRATHPDYPIDTIKMHLGQLERMIIRYHNDVPDEQVAHLICTWASDLDLQMYATLNDSEKELVRYSLCLQCTQLNQLGDQLEEAQNIQNLLFNCN